MSVDATVARVTQLEAMLGLSPAGAPISTSSASSAASTGATGSSGFAAQLAYVSVVAAAAGVPVTDASWAEIGRAHV